MAIEVVTRCDEAERVRFALKLFQVPLDTMRSVAMNDEWRSRIGVWE